MMKLIDRALNPITMYKLVLYYLIALLVIAFGYSIAGILPYDPIELLFSVAFFVAGCWAVNLIFSKTFGVPTNVESANISALILALIITPVKANAADLMFLAWVAIWAMASKYILAIRGKHIFNPVAFAVALTALTVNQTASWWVGTAPMLPFVIAGGLLIVRKIRRPDLVVSFFVTAIVTVAALSFLQGANPLTELQRTALYSPLFFFAFVILTEPLTTPPTRNLQIVYGGIVGFLFSPQVHIGGFYLTPELAVLFGNVFSYLVSPKTKLILRLRQKIQIAPDIYDFIFVPNKKLAFAPGQYMEWTLGHADPDGRGNRRYFTLASSPTENHLRVGVKFYDRSSSYKQAMLAMDSTDEIMAAQLAGDFTLPSDPRQKCVFIAGGIGVTPFRSMIKYLLDKRERRPIVMFYANRAVEDIVYKDVFDKAQKELGIKTFYTLTDKKRVPADWKGKVGYITPQIIRSEVPDYRRCIFYLSGPNAMIETFRETLQQMHVPGDHIRTDLFSGLS